VYGEEVTDLLAPGASGLQIRDGDQHQGIYVEGLSEHVVVNGERVQALPGGRRLGEGRASSRQQQGKAHVMMGGERGGWHGVLCRAAGVTSMLRNAAEERGVGGAVGRGRGSEMVLLYQSCKQKQVAAFKAPWSSTVHLALPTWPCPVSHPVQLTT
jgi:predicted phage tail protein